MASCSIPLLTLVVLAVMSKMAVGWGNDGDRVLLKDISVLTLYHGRMSNARRSAAVPQMKCMGGNAGCDSFVPQVVQCYNRGSDGYDIQWECKTDMDNAYRFGKVEVSCEGYDYADDVNVLKGSCGLEYTLDYTKEGHAQKNQGHSYYGSDSAHQDHGSSYTKSRAKGSSIFGDIVTLAVVGIIIYAIYKTCISGSGPEGVPTNDRRANGGRPYPSAPPPPGFRDEYMPGGGCSSSYDSNTHGATYGSQNTGRQNAGGGFWSGAATGGMLGYLFGSRTNTGYGYQRPYAGNTWGSGWGRSSWGSGGMGGGGGWGGGGGGGFRAAPSSGTRTASGFGGTKRR